jgi:hypothetical protein
MDRTPRRGSRRGQDTQDSNVSERDVYLALAKLVDEQGRDLGDGIAYIEHRASEPRGAKNIYVWKRMGASSTGTISSSRCSAWPARR